MANSADVQGHHNTIIQGVSWSNIQITQKLDVNEFAEALQKLLHNQKPINILILSASPKNLQNELDKNNIGFSFSDIQNCYGKEIKDWKPYPNEKTLIELLSEYQENSGFALSVFFIENPNDFLEQDFIDEIKLVIGNLVLVLDIFSLCWLGNQQIAKEFNNKNIGGCLIPSYHSNNSNISIFRLQKIQENLGSLYNYTSNYAKFVSKRADDGFINIDLEVKDKHTLFRRLTAIATYIFALKKGNIQVSIFGKGNVQNPL